MNPFEENEINIREILKLHRVRAIRNRVGKGREGIIGVQFRMKKAQTTRKRKKCAAS